MTDDLIEFLLIEKAGNVLPVFEMSFTLKNEEVLSYLNEGNVLYVAMGKSYLELMNINLIILKPPEKVKKGNDSWLVHITGCYNALDYIVGDSHYISDEVSGVEAVLECASKWFKTSSNIAKSYDKQNWIQTCQSNKAFIDDTLLHSWLRDSFISCGITVNNFILKDIKKALRESPRWYLSTTATSNKHNNIITVTPAGSSGHTGFTNYLVGYNKEHQVTDMNEGTMEDHNIAPTSMMAMETNGIPQNNSVTGSNMTMGVINDNVHPNYWKAYNQNLNNQIQYSALKSVVQFSGNFNDVRLLDLVMFGELDLDRKQLSITHSGLYFVTEVVRHITAKRFMTNLVLCRESNNGIKGENLS
jgi:hypothetical protein